MSRKDMKINRSVQRVLARQDINQEPLRYRVHAGQLQFSGRLEKQQGPNLSEAEELEKLEQQLRRVEGVIKVQWDLENWEKGDNGWDRV